MLAQHQDIVVVHNLTEFDDESETSAFEFLKKYSGRTIDLDHSCCDPYGLKSGQIIILKQGVWKHAYSFSGFILSRNPFSIYASLKLYDKEHIDYHYIENFWFNNSRRVYLWMDGVDKNKAALLEGKSPVEQFVLFYNARMGQLLETGLPVIRYEDVVRSPRSEVLKLCDILGVKMCEDMLQSHRFYEEGEIGHGGIELSSPIDPACNYKYKQNLTEFEFDYISINAKNVFTKYGYEVEGQNVISK
tara:strand:+ start:55528 stop:56265 length:738 start_codon:yes stop_codon:yes gene_type:complete